MPSGEHEEQLQTQVVLQLADTDQTKRLV